MNDKMRLLGHLVCLTQWLAFMGVERSYLGRGKCRWPYLWAGLLMTATMLYSIFSHLEFFTVTSIVLNIIFLILLSLCFGGNWSQKLVACLINGVMCLLTENTMVYILALCEDLPPTEVWKNPFSILCLMVCNLVVGGAVAYYVGVWKKRQALEPLQVLVAAFFPCVVVVINAILMIYNDAVISIWMNILLTLGLTVAVLVHLLIVDMLNEQVIKRRDSQFQAALEQEQAEALMDSYTTQCRLTHEFTNHIDALELLLQQEDVEGAKAYLQTISKTVHTSTTILNSHNPLLDALLSKKYEEASKKGVAVYYDLSDLREMPLNKTDMVTVVSNLLNNAIEAAAQSDRPEVYVRMRKTESELLIAVRNRVREDVELAEGQLPCSTKTEPGHGMGLVNVRDTLKRCHGEYTMSCREKWFRVTCSVPIGEL